MILNHMIGLSLRLRMRLFPSWFALQRTPAGSPAFQAIKPLGLLKRAAGTASQLQLLHSSGKSLACWCPAQPPSKAFLVSTSCYCFLGIGVRQIQTQCLMPWCRTPHCRVLMTELNPTIGEPCVSACVQGQMTKHHPSQKLITTNSWWIRLRNDRSKDLNRP